MKRKAPWTCADGLRMPVAAALMLCLAFGSPATQLRGAEPGSGEELLSLFRERNVFDPNRRAQRPEGPREEVAPPAPETFGLTGALLHDDVALAFFDGSAAEFRRVLSVGESVAGYSLVTINTAGVTLEREGRQVPLAVGAAMRRLGEGEWTLAEEPWDSRNARDDRRPSQAGAVDSAAGEATTSAADNDDILRRMMERRRQEESQ